MEGEATAGLLFYAVRAMHVCLCYYIYHVLNLFILNALQYDEKRWEVFGRVTN